MRIVQTALLLSLLAVSGASASECFQLAKAPTPNLIHRASMDLAEDEAGIRFIGHSTYMIEDPAGLTIATDWSGDFAYRLGAVPDVITMNRAHETHWTSSADEAIEHVLQGWGVKGKPAHHFLRLGDTLIRNVPTDTRGGEFGADVFGNSIFLFEVAGLCIGHLGHLHHTPTEEQYALLGRIDILMVPVDGGYTLGMAELLPLMERLKAQVVLPMHAFGPWTLSTFLDGMSEAGFEIERLSGNELKFSTDTLPEVPTVFVPKGV